MITSILILILLMALLYWVTTLLPSPVQMPAQAVLAIIGIIYVLQIFGVIHALLPMFRTSLS